MKILLINQAFYPDTVATAQQVTDMAAYLQESGAEVSVLADIRGYENRKIKHARSDLYRGVRVRRCWTAGFGKKHRLGRIIDAFSFHLSLLWKLFWMPRQDYVIAYTSPPLVGFLPAIFCALRGGRLVQWVFDLHPDAAVAAGYIKEGSVANGLLNGAVRFIFRQAASIVVLDKWMLARLVVHGADKEKIVIVPPWPIQKKQPERVKDDKASPFLKEYSLEQKFVVLYSGNHSVVHPLDTLLGAAVRLKDDPNIAFVFIGGGARVQDVSQYIDEHNLDNVLQLPYQPREKLDQSLSAADLHVVVMGEAVTGLVHPSKIYGILATGKPYVFIGPRESSVSDLLVECPYGFQVEHADITGLVRVIRKCQAFGQEELRVFEKKNTEFVENRYSISQSMRVFNRQVLNPSTA